jgi:acetoacetate decarboxylase
MLVAYHGDVPTQAKHALALEPSVRELANNIDSGDYIHMMFFNDPNNVKTPAGGRATQSSPDLLTASNAHTHKQNIRLIIQYVYQITTCPPSLSYERSVCDMSSSAVRPA